MNNIVTIIGIIASVSGVSVYGFIKESQTRKLRVELKEKDERLLANEMYQLIKSKKESFEEALTELLCLEEGTTINEKKRSFLRTHQKYSALFNEIEDFCTKYYDGVFGSNKYINETVAPMLSQYGELQVEFYEQLNNYATTNNLEKIKKPDYKSFEKYDKFLIDHNGGESNHYWKNLKNKRRDADFE